MKIVLKLPDILPKHMPSLSEKTVANVKRISIRVGLTILTAALILVAVWIGFDSYYANKIYPRTVVAGINIGGKTEQQAIEALSPAFDAAKTKPLVITSTDRTWEITPEKIMLSYDASQTAKRAYDRGRTGTLADRILARLASAYKAAIVRPVVTYQKEALEANVKEIATALDVVPQSAKITYVDGQFIVGPSLVGKRVNQMKLSQQIYMAAVTLRTDPIIVPIEEQQPAIPADRAQQLVPSLMQYAEQPLELRYEDKKIAFDVPTILSLIDYEHAQTAAITFDKEKLNTFIDSFAKDIERPARDGLFKFENGRVQAFTAAQDGIAVDKPELEKKLTDTLLNGGSSRVVEIPVIKTQPQTATADVNNFGIKERIGHGESNYRGSPADRIYNLKLATSRINGVLIAPGQEFSFNDSVGTIDQTTGYKQALVILAGRTVLGDGGGVCQVSTTVFRAALEAGLPITQRTAHAYRVGYYENDRGPGIDATIYQPGVDFKFKNDTEHYVLLQATIDDAATKVNIDLYGTADGRQAIVSKPVVYSTTPAPPDVYQDDPNLPKGITKMVEHSIPGARVGFTRTVTRNGETTISETFTSNYRPWQAVYLVGTKE